MLVVLDAGVFVSAVITPGGVAGHIVTAGVEGRFKYLLCPRLVGEITDVMARPKITRRVKEVDRQRFLADVLAAGRDVNDPTGVAAVSRDPDDDYLLALAAEHHAERIVTGDADLLDVVDPAVPVTACGASSTCWPSRTPSRSDQPEGGSADLSVGRVTGQAMLGRVR